MERKIWSRLLEWKSDSDKKALLVEGCRQVGKTYILKELASKEYANSVYLNFETDSKLDKIFSDGTDVDSLLQGMEIHGIAIPDSSERVLLVLDEIQASPSAYSFLKQLSEDGRFDVVASGSLLGIYLNDSALSPLGYVDIFDMYPMDFEEFLWASGISHEVTESIRNAVREMMPLKDSILDSLDELYKTFLLVGGMPDVVKSYISGGYKKAVRSQTNILRVLAADSMRYSGKSDKLKILSCLDSMPKQLAKTNKVFSYYDIELIRGYGASHYGNSIRWLRNAGIAYMVNNVTEPTEPLSSNMKDNSFKLYMSDTGLLMNKLGVELAAGVMDDAFHVNKGIIAENAIACALVSNGYRPYFFQKSNSSLEIDFLINEGKGVTAVEVKSGNYKQCKSLREVMSDRYKVPYGIMVSNSNIFIDDEGVRHYPLFGPWFFDGPCISDIKNPEDVVKALNDGSN